MEEEKLEDSITNLELAAHQLKNFIDKQKNIVQPETFEYSLKLIKESLEILRNLEIREEIERFSDEDLEIE